MRNRSKYYFKIRSSSVFIFLILCFGLIAMRAYQLQVLEREKSLKLAQHQYYYRRITLAPHRGTIYDARGRELAVSIRVNSLYAQPAKIRNKWKTASKLAPILNTDARRLHKLLSSRKPFVWLQRKITPTQGEKIRALKLKGVGFIPESRRFYPNFELGAHVIGFAGIDSQGLEGLEKVYDRYLRTADKYVVLERDALGRWIYIPSGQKGLRTPYNLYLTLDLRVQYVAERELRQGVMDLKARGGMVIVMEPSTGKILAMAVQPSFNPNLFEQYGPDRWRNRTITDPFEPGSLLKVFLLAAALEKGIAKESDIFFCENGVYKIGQDSTIHDMKHHGWLTLRDIIRFSSNIGAYKVGKRLGAEKFYRYLGAFGFNEKTGIDLLGEAKGNIRPPKSWSQVDLANISFGQGISVTALQLITALSCIANGGNLMKPYLAQRITDERGKVVVEFSPEVRKRVLSEATCRRVTSILKDVVRRGTGTLAHLADYEVAGKTGTAQKVDPLKGGYSEDKIIASFMGFVPADDPRVTILVILDEPAKSSYGGVGAAPIFRRIAEELMRYLGVPPKKQGWGKRIKLVRTSPNKKKKDEKGRKPLNHRMPDLRGLSMRKALAKLQGEKVKIKLAGSGILVWQQPDPGTPLKSGHKIFMKFAPPK
ncbi:MAG: penicillin-binding protein [Deltaproteobacteria bacterium]|nr:MAG: penicillin-binding protein [Deltaproteobacteria bacterium]